MFDTFIQLMVEIPAYFYTTVFLVSLMVGSFLNVVIHRLPKMLEKEWLCECREFLADELLQTPKLKKDEKPYNLVEPRSNCPSCGHQITALENIPVISWLVLRGKCSACKTDISPRYPLVELLTAVLSLVVAMIAGANVLTLCFIVITWALIALSFIDFDTMLLPDEITLPLIWFGLGASAMGIGIAPTDAIAGAIVGYMSLWTINWIFSKIKSQQGMGQGDFKLMAVFGAWLGWQDVFLITFLSSFVGAIFGIIILYAQKKGKDTHIPFGPYIAIAGWVVMLWGDDITNFYLQNYFY